MGNKLQDSKQLSIFSDKKEVETRLLSMFEQCNLEKHYLLKEFNQMKSV